MMNTEIEQAREGLDRAREAHAAAMLAHQSAPGDADAQRRVQEAVTQGKAAWKGYRAAATAGLAQQITDIVPTAFLEDKE